MLNADQVPTATGKTWNQRRVESVRKNHGIPTTCPYFTPESGPRGDGLTAAPEAAKRLGVSSSSMIAYWFRKGLLPGHQRQPQAAVWVRLTEEDISRLNGSASLQSGMVPVQQVPEALDMTPEQMRDEIRAGRLLTYRLIINNRWQWYVQLPTERDNSHI